MANIPISTGSGAASVAGETIGGITYQQIEVYGGGGASVMSVNPDGSIKVSVLGTVTTSFSGSPSISGAVTVIGNPSISGAVQISGQSPASIATVQRLDLQVIGSSLGLVTHAVVHGLTSAGGGAYVDVKVDPSGALVTTASSVVSFQGGTRTTSIVGAASVVQLGAWSASIAGGFANLYAPSASFISGVTSVITSTGLTSVLTAAGGSIKNYVTNILVTNGAATGTFVDIKDGGGNVLYSGYAAASGGGFSATLPVPLVGSANKSVDAQPRAQASIIVAMTGYTA